MRSNRPAEVEPMTPKPVGGNGAAPHRHVRPALDADKVNYPQRSEGRARHNVSILVFEELKQRFP
jgi:hypothetical protein